jgi:undecaprenyl-diphosphatase
MERKIIIMSLSQMDYHLFQIINNLAGTFTIINPLMRILANDGEYLFFLGILVYWFAPAKANRRMVLQSLVAACISLMIGGWLAQLFYHDRPFVTHVVFQLIQHQANASFPSDHATGAFVIATAIWLYRKKEGTVWLFVAGCIAFSRIWVGVHYPSDVVVGAILGIFSAVGIHYLFNRWVIANKCLQVVIGFYEKIETKVLRKKITKVELN